MNIICLYWVGNFRGRDFNINDVMRLYYSVLKHIDCSFNFYCLTNCHETLPSVIEKIKLRHDWIGWWSKVELHRPDLPKGRTLYLDLDSHVIRRLRPILDYKGDLVMFSSKAVAGRGIVKKYQAATMLFDSGTKVMVDLYDKFKSDPDYWMAKYRSEQDIMGAWMPDQPTFPDSWMSKLSIVRDLKKAPEDCIIVTGQPVDKLFRRTEEVPWLDEMARA